MSTESTWQPETPVRVWLLGMGDFALFARTLRYRDRLKEFAGFLYYASRHPSRRKRKPMTDQELEQLARDWADRIAVLTTAATRDDYDAADFSLDEVLHPILSAPVAQLRQFARRLAEILEAERRAPYWVVRGFKELLTNIVQKAPDGQVIGLKTELARQIATAAEKHIGPAMVGEALTNALQWRDEETLRQVKDALDRGAKPRLRGRQSCVFFSLDEQFTALEVDGPDGNPLQVML